MDGGEFPRIEKPASVRLAGPMDEEKIYDLLMALDRDNGFGIPISEKKIREAIKKGTEQKGGVIGIIDGKDGEVAGSVSLVVTSPWYSVEYHLQEGWLFVRPGYRSIGHHYRDLFNFMKWACATMEGEGNQRWYVITQVWSLRNLPLKMRLWARFGKHIGGIFRMGAR